MLSSHIFPQTFLQHIILLGSKQAAIVWISSSPGLLSHSSSVFIIYFCLQMVTHLKFTVCHAEVTVVLFVQFEILSCGNSKGIYCHPNKTQQLIGKTYS